jgi:hypothetical protein
MQGRKWIGMNNVAHLSEENRARNVNGKDVIPRLFINLIQSSHRHNPGAQDQKVDLAFRTGLGFKLLDGLDYFGGELFCGFMIGYVGSNRGNGCISAASGRANRFGKFFAGIRR